MPISQFTAEEGDTFLGVSRLIFGDDTHEVEIRQANSGVSEPFQSNVSLVIPQDTTPQDPPPVANVSFNGSGLPRVVDGAQTVRVVVNGEEVQRWTEIIFTDELDGMPTCSVKLPFDDVAAKVFAPLQFQVVQVFFGNLLMFTGNVFNPDPRASVDGKTLVVECYSKPAVLWDCCPPASQSGELQFRKQILEDISASLLGPFGIDIAVETNFYDPTQFKRVAINSDELIGPFITKLAKQRRLVVGATPDGKLAFRNDETPSLAVAKLEEGTPSVDRIKLQLNQREFFSEVAGFRPSVLEELGGRRSVPVIKRVPGASFVRPKTVILSDIEKGEMETATAAAFGRMYANVATWTVHTPTWFASGNTVWESGQRVELLAPGVFVDRVYELTVRKVTFTFNKDRQIARLDLMFPNAFAGQAPSDGFPWEPKPQVSGRPIIDSLRPQGTET